ncbi:MAG: translation initiation factor IF-3 [Parcubacteria group bacterium]|nr:translation initiation factor IF-3 [Parcubacteria group bacterium]
MKPGRPGSADSPRINNQIRATSLRVIDDQGSNLGVIELEQALALARERGLDLIEIAPTANPPVAKIMDYGKFLYVEEKKRKKGTKTARSEIKEVRIGINTSPHDLELKAKRAIAFLEEGHRIKVELMLRGRAKYLDEQFIRGRVERLLTQISTPFIISEELRKGPRGRHLVIERSSAKKKAAPRPTTNNHAHAGENKQIVSETPEAHRTQEGTAA